MILLTGATGFVGGLLLDKLLASGHHVICLARNPSAIPARDHLTVIKADLENSEVITTIDDLVKLKDVETIVHLAALYDLSADMSKCYMANVVASMNLVNLSRKLTRLKHFIHISTVAISGNFNGLVEHDKHEFDQSFPNAYAKTKAQAEGFIRRSVDKDILCILRPGIIIGDSNDMSIFKADGPYMAIKYAQKLINKYPFISKLPFIFLPINTKSNLPLITVDAVVDSIFYSIENRLLSCHHLVLPSAPKVLEFAQDMLNGLGLKTKVKAIRTNDKVLNTLKRIPFDDSMPRELLDYMVIAADYSLTKDSGLLKILNSNTWSEIKSPFFREATKS